jgi:putative oxidoreductase
MLGKILPPLTERAYALLRIAVGFMFAFHGIQKIFGVLNPHGAPAVGSQMWFGGLIELIGGTLVMVGFLTRYAAFIASGTMAVAYFQFHNKFSGSNWLPGVNQGELAAVYAFLFLFIACRGGGTWSVDECRKSPRAT